MIQHKNWTLFPYTRKETISFTRVFKCTNLKANYKADKSLERTLSRKQIDHNRKCLPSGYNKYKLMYLDCNKAYFGQTLEASNTVRKNTTSLFRNNNFNSKFAEHC